jgi:hypothetical protein
MFELVASFMNPIDTKLHCPLGLAASLNFDVETRGATQNFKFAALLSACFPTVWQPCKTI